MAAWPPGLAGAPGVAWVGSRLTTYLRPRRQDDTKTITTPRSAVRSRPGAALSFLRHKRPGCPRDSWKASQAVASSESGLTHCCSQRRLMEHLRKGGFDAPGECAAVADLQGQIGAPRAAFAAFSALHARFDRACRGNFGIRCGDLPHSCTTSSFATVSSLLRRFSR